MKMSMTTRSVREPSAELLTWDSEFWQARIAKGNSSTLDKWARENTIGCMCLLIPAHDQADIHRAEANGARVMDVRVRYERETSHEPTLCHPILPRSIDQAAMIARTAFRGLTRFYADPRFPDERCDDLYEGWLRSSCDGWAAEVLTVGSRRKTRGFVTIHVDDDTASIGLIAVSEEARGEGFGSKLTRAAADWAYEQGIPFISVITQAGNIPAQRAFQRAGFVITSTDVWLHRHYEEKS